jgi:hypothetical protein
MISSDHQTTTFLGDTRGDVGVHVDPSRSNTAVGPDVFAVGGMRNALMGVGIATGAPSYDNSLVGYKAGGKPGKYNVIIGSNAAASAGEGTRQSVVVGALAGRSSRTIDNSVIIGAAAAAVSTDITRSVLLGPTLTAPSGSLQCAFVGTGSQLGSGEAAPPSMVAALTVASYVSGERVAALGVGVRSTANDAVVVGSNILAAGERSIAIGQDLTIASDTRRVTLIGTGTTVAPNVTDVLAVGAGDMLIEESGTTILGSFLRHSQSRGVTELTAPVVVLGGGQMRIAEGQGIAMKDLTADALTIRDGDGHWVISLSPAREDGIDGHDLVFASAAGTRVIFGDTFVPAITNFTGQHRCVVADGEDPALLVPGAVLVAVGRYVSLEGSKEIAVDEAIPVVRVSRRRRDARAFGVVSSLESDGGVRSVSVGNIRFEGARGDSLPRVVVNSCGEGAILVSREAGFVRNGDLLCTSSSPGVAMRQRRQVVTAFTVAKATCDALVRKGETVLIGCVYRF